jgi:hypothetical protein
LRIAGGRGEDRWMSGPFQLPTLGEARALGATLRAVDPRLLKHGSDGARWYTGGEPYLEASLEAPGGVVVAVDVSVRGHVLRWTAGAGARTGRTDEHQLQAGAPSSRLVRLDNDAQPDVVAVVVALLSGCADPLLHAAADTLGNPR